MVSKIKGNIHKKKILMAFESVSGTDQKSMGPTEVIKMIEIAKIFYNTQK